MTDILADLAGTAKRTGPSCIRVRLQRDNPELAAEFDRALASPFSNSAIAEWFTQHGVEMGLEAVRRHRTNGCMSCRS